RALLEPVLPRGRLRVMPGALRHAPFEAAFAGQFRAHSKQGARYAPLRESTARRHSNHPEIYGVPEPEPGPLRFVQFVHRHQRRADWSEPGIAWNAIGHWRL